MKKIMAITLVLAMVIAMGVTSSAAVGSKWTVLEINKSVGGGAVTENGKVTDDNGSLKIDAPEGAEGTQSFNQAGVCFKDAVKVDGLTLVVTPNLMNAAANGQAYAHMGFTITKTAQTSFDAIASSNAILTPGTAAEETFFLGFYNNTAGDKMSIMVGGGALGVDFTTITQTVTPGTDVTITLNVVDGALQVTLNGAVIYTYTAEATAAILTDGNAYLSLQSVGWGYAGNTSPFVVKTINGVAANSFGTDSETSSDTDNGSSNPDTADAIVYAVAAMAVCGAVLAAAAFKAKKVK